MDGQWRVATARIVRRAGHLRATASVSRSLSSRTIHVLARPAAAMAAADMFRSRPMAYIQLFLRSDTAFDMMLRVGELACVQLLDVRSAVAAPLLRPMA